MASIPLTHADLSILRRVLADAHRVGKLSDRAHDRTVITLAAAGHRLQETRP